MEEITLKVPKTLNDITVRQYRKWAKIFENNKDVKNNFLEIKLLETFCNISALDAQKLPLGSADHAIEHVVGLLNQEPGLTERFKMTGSDGVTVEFGFIPNLSKMTLGEYVDLDTYISKSEELHRVMAILYRPIHKSYEKLLGYRVADYQGTDLMAEVMNDMPLDIAFGALVFFYHLEKKLLTHTMLSSLSTVTTEKLINSAEERKNLQTVTDGIKAYMLLQEEERLKSKLRLNSLSMKQ